MTSCCSSMVGRRIETPNTAHGQSTEPLPFHSMSQFPYRPRTSGFRTVLNTGSTFEAITQGPR